MAHPLDALVRKLEVDSNLSSQERDAVLHLPTAIRHLPPNADILRDRDKPLQCCLILEGWLIRHKIVEKGARQIMAFHIPGDVPDLQSIHLNTMDHNLATLTESTVAFLQHDAIRDLVDRHPRIGGLLWRDTLIDAAIFREWIVVMGRRLAPQRIAHLICELFVKMRAVGLATEDSCDFPIAYRAIGDALGLSTVHVNRSIQNLRDQGLITLERQCLTILNWKELQAFGGFDSLYLHMDRSAGLD